MVVIVDYGMGNLRSIQAKLQLIKISSIISSKPEEIAQATRLILPGVGHFGAGMRNLRESGLIEPLRKRVIEQKTPIMGICLGMQLLTKGSEEGDAEGLGWINASTKRFNFNSEAVRLRVPHVGWNLVRPRKDSILFRDIPEGRRFYFTHSYFVESQDAAVVLGTAEYGREFVCAVQKDNIYGTQFHPEKSHQYGLKMIENFVRFAS